MVLGWWRASHWPCLKAMVEDLFLTVFYSPGWKVIVIGESSSAQLWRFLCRAVLGAHTAQNSYSTRTVSLCSLINGFCCLIYSYLLLLLSLKCIEECLNQEKRSLGAAICCYISNCYFRENLAEVSCDVNTTLDEREKNNFVSC